MKIVTSIFLITLFCSSCSTVVNKSYINAPVGVSSSVQVDADIKLGDEVLGEAEETSLFGLLRLSGPKYYADNVFGGIRSAAAYNALKGTGADVIVNPQYVYEVDKFLFITTTKCTVTGIAGKVSVIK